MIPLFENADQVFSTLIVWLTGFLVIEVIRKKIELNFLFSHILYIWHSFFCIVYKIYTNTNYSDSVRYYNNALSGDAAFGLGANFIDYFSATLINWFNLSYFGLFVLFNIFGSIGLIMFAASLKIAVENKSKFVKLLALITILLPGVSFWSASLGKDALAFMATCIALWAALEFPKRLLLMVFSIIIFLLIRPYMAFLLFAVTVVALVVRKETKMIIKITSLAFGVIMIITTIPLLMDYANIETLQNVYDIFDFIEARQSYNLYGGGAINISEMSHIERVFTYLYRPLPQETKNIAGVVASIENLYLLLLSLMCLVGFLINRKKQTSYNTIIIIVYPLLCVALLSATTSNIGISLRQKWMFLPFMIYIFFNFIGLKKGDSYVDKYSQ